MPNKTAIISIHAPRAGGDRVLFRAGAYGDISIHAPRAGGDTNDVRSRTNTEDISIHAPRAGGDYKNSLVYSYCNDISIHAPRAGGDPQAGNCWAAITAFQSTPPVRGATVKIRIFIRIFK